MKTMTFYPKRISASLYLALAGTFFAVTASATVPVSEVASGGKREAVVSVFIWQGHNILTQLNDQARALCRSEDASLRDGFMTNYQIIEQDKGWAKVKMEYVCK